MGVILILLATCELGESFATFIIYACILNAMSIYIILILFLYNLFFQVEAEELEKISLHYEIECVPSFVLLKVRMILPLISLFLRF